MQIVAGHSLWTRKGWLCKFYEGIEARLLSEHLLKGEDVQKFAQQVNQLLGHTPADVRQIIQTTCQKLGIPTEYYLPG